MAQSMARRIKEKGGGGGAEGGEGERGGGARSEEREGTTIESKRISYSGLIFPLFLK